MTFWQQCTEARASYLNTPDLYTPIHPERQSSMPLLLHVCSPPLCLAAMPTAYLRSSGAPQLHKSTSPRLHAVTVSGSLYLLLPRLHACIPASIFRYLDIATLTALTAPCLYALTFYSLAGRFHTFILSHSQRTSRASCLLSSTSRSIFGLPLEAQSLMLLGLHVSRPATCLPGS